MVIIDIASVGDERFVRGMNRYVSEMHDFREVFKDIEEDFREINKKNFAAGGTPKSFKPASNPAYIEWKMARVGHNKPMILFDTLRKSLTGDTEASVSDIRKQSAFFSTNVPYVNYHYYGRGSKAVQLTKEDKTRWARIIQTWAFKKWQKKLSGDKGRELI